MSRPTWICGQHGAREHYAVPRALHGRRELACLFADAWVRPGHPLGWLQPSLRDRFHPQLRDAPVLSATLGLVAFEALAHLRGLRGWEVTMARNGWFQRRAVAALSRQCNPQLSTLNSQPIPIVFAYSYAALGILRWAKDRGFRTVLGQIDPGPEMVRIARELEQRHEEFKGRSIAPPEIYWTQWQEECELADVIVVNSEWSRTALQTAGVEQAKLRVVPLAYEPPPGSGGYRRSYPDKFTRERPLRVLFLGQANLLKGLVPLLEAAELLAKEPVEFIVVGPVSINLPPRFQNHAGIRWVGPVARRATSAFYREADVFLFPSFCDGFGLTQLEAQAWKLPIVASGFCGEVVADGVNGLRLAEVTGGAVAVALRGLLRDPGALRRMSENSLRGGPFALERIGEQMSEIAAATACPVAGLGEAGGLKGKW